MKEEHVHAGHWFRDKSEALPHQPRTKGKAGDAKRQEAEAFALLLNNSKAKIRGFQILGVQDQD